MVDDHIGTDRHDRWIESSVAWHAGATGPEAAVTARLQGISRALAVLLMLLGTSVIVGWLASIEALTTVVPGLASMKLNTAAGFVLLGVSLSALGARVPARRAAAPLAAGVYGLLGLASLAEYAFSVSFGIDDPFHLDNSSAVHPGRMAIMTAVCFIAMACSVAALATGRYRIGQLAALGVLGVAAVAGVGYVFSVRSLYEVGAYSTMAVHTVSGFGCAAIAALASRPAAGFASLATGSSAGSVTVRRLLVPALAGPLVLGGAVEVLRSGAELSESFALATMTIVTMGAASVLVWITGNRLRHIDTRRAGAESAFREAATALAERDAAVSELQAARDALAESEADYRRIVDLAAEGICAVDADGATTFANARFGELLGVAVDDLIGRSPFEALAPEAQVLRREHRPTLRAGTAIVGLELPADRADGTRVWLSVNIAPILDAEGTYQGAIAMASDITAQREQRTQLEFLARHDPLTMLPNRLQLRERLEVEISDLGAERGRLAVAYVDLDGFKAVNDQQGHQAGDDLLIHVARRLQTLVRPEDMVARVGGDEFVVVVRSYPPLPEAEIAARLHSAFDQPFRLPAGDTGLGASIGVVFACPGDTVEGLLDTADRSMYQIKTSRR